jgi:hypothetical protein
MAHVREAGRLLGLDPSDWFVLVAGVALSGVLALLCS